jgi:hypothetical protein
VGIGKEQQPGHAREHADGQGRTRLPVLLVDGVIAGMWEWRRRGRRIALRVEPFDEFTAAQRQQLEAEAARIGEFLGADAELALGTLLIST